MPIVRIAIKRLIVISLGILFATGYFNQFPLPGFISKTYSLALAAIITGSAWGYGSLLMNENLMDYLSVEESFVFPTMAGFGALSLLMVIAGVAGGWTPMGGFVLVLSGLGLCWRNKEYGRRFLLSVPAYLEEIPRAPLFLIWIGAGLSLLGAFAPATFYDSLVYHYALPNAYIQAGHWIGQKELIYSAFPQIMEMLWTLGMIFINDQLANLLGWVIAMLGITMVLSFGKRFFGIKTGSWAAALLAVMPAYTLLSTGGYVDVDLAVYSFMSFYALLLWNQTSLEELPGAYGSGFLALAGFFAGCAIGCKYTGAIPMGIGGLIILKERRFFKLKDIIWAETIYCGIALLVFSPWLIKNLYYVGNPVFPFFYQWSFTPQNPWLGTAAAGYFEGITAYAPRSGWQLFKLIWDIAVHGLNFGGGMDVLGDLGWAPFIFLLPAAWLARKNTRPLPALLLYILCFFLSWGMSRPVLRFLMPLTPFLALVAAYGYDRGIMTQPNSLRRMAHLLIAAFFLSSYRAFFDFTDFLSLYNVPLGLESRSLYLTRKLNYFAAASFVNTLPENSLTYVVGDQRSYYYNRPILVTPAFNKNPLTDWANEAASAEDLEARLKERHVTHLLINDSEMKRLDSAYHIFPFTPQGRNNWERLRIRLAPPVFHDNHCEVLALS